MRITLQQNLRFRAAQIGAQLLEEKNLQNIFKFSAIAAGAVFMIGLTLFIASHQATAKQARNSAPAAVATIATSTASTTAIVMREMNVANNGLTYVKGAEVTDTFMGGFEITITWGETNFVWAVKTSDLTKFYDHAGQKQTAGDINVGDIVSVTGKLINTENKPTLNAEYVRE